MLSILFLIIHFQHDVDQQTGTLKETKQKKQQFIRTFMFRWDKLQQLNWVKSITQV